MKITRTWYNAKGDLEQPKEITEERASLDLANAHGDNAVSKLKEEGVLETRFAIYKTTD